MSRIAVTELEYRKGRTVWEAAGDFEVLRAAADEEALAAVVREENVRHVVLGVDRYEGPLYSALRPGAVIVRYGVGHDGVDKVRATSEGILCTNTPGVLDGSVAEYTIALMIAAARSICPLSHLLAAGEWQPAVGWELRGRTLAVIGCGAIGRHVARIAAGALGMRVIGCEVAEVDVDELSKWGFDTVVREFKEAAPQADFVSLHIPSTSRTQHFIDSARLALMRPEAWLINTARGAIVNELHLYDALRDGTIAGAALDVFETEPYRPVDTQHDLRKVPNVILTPHVASSTQEACRRTAQMALEDIRHAEAGEYAKMHLLNPEVVSKLEQ